MSLHTKGRMMSWREGVGRPLGQLVSLAELYECTKSSDQGAMLDVHEH